MNYKDKFYKYHCLEKFDIIFCVVCGQKATQLHHVKLKSHGGTDDPDNICPLCMACHSGHHNSNKPTTEQIIIARNKNLYNPELTFNIIEV